MESASDVRVESGQSAAISKLAAALAKAQAVFEQPKNIKRGQQGHRTFKYAPLPEIYRAIRPGLSQNELADVSYWEEIGGKLYMTTELRHSGGGVIASRWPISGTTDPQERGKEGTYGRRNNICALTGVVGEELDADDGDGETEREAAEAAKRQEAEKRLDALKGKGTVRSAYDGKVLAPGEAALPGERAAAQESGDRSQNTARAPEAGGQKDGGQGTGRPTPEERDAAKAPASAASPSTARRPRDARSAGESGADPLAGIAQPLADLMRRDGITVEMLRRYYVGKRHLPESVAPTALPADYVAGLTKPENWKRAVAGMKGGK